MNAIDEILHIIIEKIIFLSHSLGSEFALHIWHSLWTYPLNPYSAKLQLNYMFNPFIIVDNVLTSSLDMDDTYKNTIQASIVEGDVFASLYKHNPIGPIKIYGNLVVETSSEWYSYADFIANQYNWLQYLDLRNHRLISFLQEDNTAYPSSAYIHYIPQPSSKHIQTRRTYSIHIRENGIDEFITGEHLQMRLFKDDDTHTWRLSNININSDGNHIGEFDMNIRYSNEPHLMIYFNNQWSLPFIISGDNNADRMYLFKSINPNQIDPLYYLGKLLGNTLYFIKPYSNIAGNDYTYYLHRQVLEYTSIYNKHISRINNSTKCWNGWIKTP
jgi:hypothetical protein